MMRVFQSSWVMALIGCALYLSTTLALLSPAKFVVARTALEETMGVVLTEQPSWNFRNPEFEQWVEEIRRQRDALALREQQLQELQTRLEAERKELSYATQLVSRLQAEFDKNVVRITDQEADNLKRQAKVLSSMSPEAGAGLLNDMAEEEAVRILVAMKADEASAILEALSKLGKPEAKRAATFTEKMRRTLPAPSKTGAKSSP
jgi:flagellar motility protein MotE (MotC chaperone)